MLEEEKILINGSGHVVDDRNLFPITVYLYLVWETIDMMIRQLYMKVPVVIEDVKFNRTTTISKEGKVEMIVMIRKSNYFLLFVCKLFIKEFNIYQSLQMYTGSG